MLDYNQSPLNANIITSSLGLGGGGNGGGTLVIRGHDGTTVSQAFTGVTLYSSNLIQVTAGVSGTINVDIGAITRNGNGYIDFTLPASGGIGTTTANANFSGGQATILGCFATVGGTTWAVSGSGTTAGNITGLTGYSPSFTSAASGGCARGHQHTGSHDDQLPPLQCPRLGDGKCHRQPNDCHRRHP